MKQKQPSNWIRLFAVGLMWALANLLNVGLLFWVVFLVVGWVFVAPKIDEVLKKRKK